MEYTPCEECNKSTSGRCPEHINNKLAGIKVAICPIEDGTCPGTNGGKCPNEASGHIIRAQYRKDLENK